MQTDPVSLVFGLLILIFSAIIHEVMHGVAADKLGDPTARYAGRLTLNPIPHIDLFGSILVPFLLLYSHSPIFFAWAKPVPYNPFNLRSGIFSEAVVAGAGPLSNLAIALLAGALVRLGLFPGANDILLVIVLINVMLFAFNLIPIPPLDGSKVFEAILPQPLSVMYERFRRRLEYSPFIGMALVLILIIFLGNIWGKFIYSVAGLIAGV